DGHAEDVACGAGRIGAFLEHAVLEDVGASVAVEPEREIDLVEASIAVRAAETGDPVRIRIRHPELRVSVARLEHLLRDRAGIVASVAATGLHESVAARSDVHAMRPVHVLVGGSGRAETNEHEYPDAEHVEGRGASDIRCSGAHGLSPSNYVSENGRG